MSTEAQQSKALAAVGGDELHAQNHSNVGGVGGWLAGWVAGWVPHRR